MKNRFLLFFSTFSAVLLLTPFHAEMAAYVKVALGWTLIFLISSFITAVSGVYYLDKQTPADCKRGSNDEYHQFFDISQLRCVNCAQTRIFQTVTEDGEWRLFTKLLVSKYPTVFFAWIETTEKCVDHCVRTKFTD